MNLVLIQNWIGCKMFYLLSIIILFIYFIANRLSNAWKKAMLDIARDKLFDIRDDIRMQFHDHSVSLDFQAFKTMNNLVNFYLKFIGTQNYKQVIELNKFVKTLDGYKQLYIAIDYQFKTPSQDLNTIINEKRNEVFQILYDYHLRSSILRFCLYNSVDTILNLFNRNTYSEEIKNNLEALSIQRYTPALCAA
jgi:hypothetical protein